MKMGYNIGFAIIVLSFVSCSTSKQVDESDNELFTKHLANVLSVDSVKITETADQLSVVGYSSEISDSNSLSLLLSNGFLECYEYLLNKPSISYNFQIQIDIPGISSKSFSLNELSTKYSGKKVCDNYIEHKDKGTQYAEYVHSKYKANETIEWSLDHSFTFLGLQSEVISFYEEEKETLVYKYYVEPEELLLWIYYSPQEQKILGSITPAH